MSTSPALPGTIPGRQPYGTIPGRFTPIVPHVVLVGDRRNSFAPPPLTRVATVYETPTTVRVRHATGTEETKQQHHVWCVPDDAAWGQLEAAHLALAGRLVELAEALRALGRYDRRLAAAGGLKSAPNPLTPTVIGCDDPDDRPRWFNLAWHIPRLERKTITRHTAKMLFYRYSAASEAESSSSQESYFLCPGDADWARVQELHAAVEAATRAMTRLLDTLGTYQDALDGRHDRPAAPPTPVAVERGLTVVAPAIEGVLVMTEAEARAAADAIKGAVEDLRVKIDQFDQGRGWKVLGYDSFRAWAAAEIPDTSLRHVYRLRDANEVDRSLGVPAGTTPEAHARELKPVPPPQRADVLKQADARAAGAGRERTAADVRQVAQAVTNGHTPAPLPPRLADVAEQLRRGDWHEAYARARMTGEDYPRAIAAVDALVEGRPLDEALALLSGPPPRPAPAAEVITVQTKGGPREAPVLKRSGVLALTPAWYAAKETAPPVLSERHWTVTHVPTGYMVGRLIADRAEADRLFDQAAALDWSQVPPNGAVPLALAEQLAAIFGLSFPADETYQRAAARAARLGLHVGRAVRNDGTGTRIYVLTPEPPGSGAPADFTSWAAMIAHLDAQEVRAAPPRPAFDYAHWERRAAAVGANLKAYGLDYELVARGQSRGTRYPDGEEAALTAAIVALEAGRPIPPPPAPVPLDDDASPDAAAWAYGLDAAGEVVVSVDRGALPAAAADAIAAAAAALRALALGEAVDTPALDTLVATLGEHLEWPGAATLMAVLEEIASDADALASRGGS